MSSPRTRRRRELGNEDGAGLIEFAFVAPLLFALVLGIFTGGLAYTKKIGMTDAVREAARFGATLDDGSSWAVSVRQRAVEASAKELQKGDVCAKLVRVETSGSTTTLRASPATCPFGGEPANPSGVAGGTCLAKVWAEDDAKLEVLFFSMDLTLEADAVARYERVCP